MEHLLLLSVPGQQNPLMNLVLPFLPMECFAYAKIIQLMAISFELTQQ